ncbi:hypothetical protein LNP74_17435 [Klebsiella pneumoniae subsp. pneumoniae]|nr:hypothetical protein [Klebsiella pneumoniae subsp. pneumoniae]
MTLTLAALFGALPLVLSRAMASRAAPASGDPTIVGGLSDEPAVKRSTPRRWSIFSLTVCGCVFRVTPLQPVKRIT